MQLMELKKEYVNELVCKEKLLNIKINELNTEKDILIKYISDRDKLQFDNSTVEDDILYIENKIKEIKRIIYELIQSKVILRTELNSTFSINISKRKNLKLKIENIERKIRYGKNKYDEIISKKSELEFMRKSDILEKIDNEIKEQQMKISNLDMEINGIKDDIERINKNLLDINSKINNQELNERKLESDMFKSNGNCISCCSKANEKQNSYEMKRQYTSFYCAILKISMIDECDNFFEELLEKSGYKKLEERVLLARLLERNKSNDEINKKIVVSTATISRVNQMLKQNYKFNLIIKEINNGKFLKDSFFYLIRRCKSEEESKTIFNCLFSRGECENFETYFYIAESLYYEKNNKELELETGISMISITRIKKIIEKKDSCLRKIFTKMNNKYNLPENNNQKELILADDLNSKNQNEDKEKLIHHLLYFRFRDVDALGFENEDHTFTLKKGSRISVRNSLSFNKKYIQLRKKYENIISDSGVLIDEITFKSIEEATDFCTLYNTSYDLMWKNGSGITLRKIRKAESMENNFIIQDTTSYRKFDIEKKNTKKEEIELTEENIFINDEKTELNIGEKQSKNLNKEIKIVCSSEIERKKMPFFEQYRLSPELYYGIDIESVGFSVRLVNRLKYNGILDVNTLLKTNDNKLGKIKGFGKGCYDEVHTYLSTLTTKQINNSNINQFRVPMELIPYVNLILIGDFSFLNNISISSSSENFINKLKYAHSILDYELVENIINGDSEIFRIIEMLHIYANRIDNEIKVNEYLKSIPKNRLDTNILIILKYYSENETILEYLKNAINHNQQTLKEFFCKNSKLIGENKPILTDFIKWCQYNLKNEINYFFSQIINNDRDLQLLDLRIKGKTLEEIGKTFNITRERVRQIENKVKQKFNVWQNTNRIIYKIILDMNQEELISPEDIVNYIGINGKRLVFLLKEYNYEKFIYIDKLDTFILVDVSLVENAYIYVQTLPDVFNEDKLDDFLHFIDINEKYSSTLVRSLIKKYYSKSGKIYHRFKLNLSTIYGNIMENYYPDGIHIYDEKEIQDFREYVMNDYNIDISDKSVHSIGAILSRIGILCGRGIYKFYDENKCISSELAKQIHDYVNTSTVPIFLTNTLFSIFEKKLLAEGIDNKYYLQGILRKLYEDEWIFRRDYISKDKSYTSVYSSVVEYIKNSKYPVSKADICKEFPGVTEIVINMAVGDFDILNLFGKYIHVTRLKLTDKDKKYLENVINLLIKDKEVCHCREIYDYISSDYPEVLINNYINIPFSLFSLLEYIFAEQYNFSRPYVAEKNASIERGIDVLKNIIHESEFIEISDILSFAKEHNIVIGNILEFIDSCNDSHLLINNLEIASVKYIGITESIAKEIESRIVNEICSTVPIHQLESINLFPRINVEWSAWLIYSILKKWSTKLEVKSSANQFKLSYPIVAPLGCLNLDSIEKLKGMHNAEVVLADDLSRIDDLISDYIIDDLEDFS